MPVPETADDFIDWMLLSQEARDMQLQDNSAYQKKLHVFLKVRALLQLKAEEIDAHTSIPTHADLWAAYQEAYTPILNLRMLALPSVEHADSIKALLTQGIPFTEVIATAGLDTVAETMAATGPLRFSRIPDSLRQLALNLKTGEVGGPALFGHSWYFLEVLERNDGSLDDFETVKQALIRDARKAQEYQLTFELVERLKKDYQVKVHQEIIDAIPAAGISADLAQKVAVQFKDLEIPADVIFSAAVKAQQLRGQARKGAEDFKASKARVVNDLLMQTLTGVEALARHYEEVPPLKQVYSFYSQHRLIKELETTIIRPQVKVAESEIRDYYKQNSNKYIRKGLVEIAVVKTRELQLAKKLNRDLKAGGDFFTVMEPISPAGVQVKKVPLQHLAPLVQREVAKLSSGQMVGGIEAGDEILFIKLVRKGAQESVPLEKVVEEIRQQLKNDRFGQLRAVMLKQLRSRSDIRLNSAAWKKLKKALTGGS